MSPEQWCGDEVDARTDQFSFCVALWSAAWGLAPFPGTNAVTLRGSVLSGKRRAIPARSGVPRWLEPLLARGLATDPDNRWPSLGELLDAIERRMSARRRATVIASAAAAIGAAAIAVTVMSVTRTADDPCALPSDRLDAVWSSARRANIEHHLAGIDPALGAKRFAAVSSVLDRSAPAWGETYVAACRATRVDGRQSDTLLDLRMTCLDDWLGRFDNIAKNLEAATTAGQLEGAIKGVSTIAELSRCSDTQLLQLEAPPPVDPAARAEGDAIVAEARSILTAIRSGKWDGLEARGDALVARARKIAHPAALAKAIGIRARIAVSRQDTKGAMTMLREDVEAASRAHDDEEVGKAWMLMVRLSSMFQGHPEEAKAIMPAARAASARIGDPPLLLAQILTDEADVLSFHGDTEHALADLDRARHLLEGAGATQPGSPSAPILGSLLHSLGNTYWNAGKLDLAEAQLRDAIAVIDRAYGPDTVESSSAYLALGQVLRDDDKLVDAEHALRESIRIREARAPDSALTATALVALADVLDSQPTKIAEGIAVAERGVEMARKTMPVDATFAGNLASLGDAYAAAGRYKEAIAIYDEMFVIVAKDKIEDINVASWEINRGEIYRKLGRCDEAIAAFQRGAKVGVKIEGPTTHYIASSQRSTGFCLHDLHRDAEAIAALESSIVTPPANGNGQGYQIARGLLGELLVDTGRDRTRGLALAKEAGEALHAAHAVDPFVADHDAWLKRH
jgi:tetratricopeptide (TPR) repeat protein